MVLIASTVILSWIIANRCYKIQKRKLSLEEYQININSATSSDIDEALDALIKDSVTEYVILNIEYRPDIEFINSEIEESILNAVKDSVSKKLSPAFMQKLSLYYNSAAIPDIVSQKIYMAVTAYVADHNIVKK